MRKVFSVPVCRISRVAEGANVARRRGYTARLWLGASRQELASSRGLEVGGYF